MACASNLRGIGQALRGYLNESNDILPVVAYMPSLQVEEPFLPTLPDTLRPHLEKDSGAQTTDMEVFHCPGDIPGVTDRGQPNQNKSFFATEGSSYVFNTMLYFIMMEDPSDPSSIKPTSMYNLVRNPRLTNYLGRQVAEQEVSVISDYANFHVDKESSRKEGVSHKKNYLYIDGHVSDFETL